MLAKIFGYLIGGLFVILFFAPLPIAIWLIYDRVQVIRKSELVPAKIVDVYSKRNSGSNSKLGFGPVAETENGIRVKGEFRWSRRSWVESDIGKEVSVFLHQDDVSQSRINSFLQFWFLPILFSVISFVIYPLGYYAKYKKRLERQEKS